MKYRKLLQCAFIIVVILSSCQERKPDLKELVEDFAELECRAISLREKRFELANQIRFTQDSLSIHAGKADTTQFKSKLDSYNLVKNQVLQQSLSLADSIKVRLSDIMQNQLTEVSDKKMFNDMLNKTLEQKGCVDQNN